MFTFKILSTFTQLIWWLSLIKVTDFLAQIRFPVLAVCLFYTSHMLLQHFGKYEILICDCHCKIDYSQGVNSLGVALG